MHWDSEVKWLSALHSAAICTIHHWPEFSAPSNSLRHLVPIFVVAWVCIYVSGVTAISNLCFMAPTSPPPLIALAVLRVLFEESFLSGLFLRALRGCVDIRHLSSGFLHGICPVLSKCAGHPNLLLDTTAKRCQGHLGFHAVVVTTDAPLSCFVFRHGYQTAGSLIILES